MSILISDLVSKWFPFGEQVLGSKVFTFNGEDYVCIYQPATEEDVVVFGGKERIADLVLIVRIELFTDNLFPTSQTELDFNGKTYAVAEATRNVPPQSITLKCVSNTRMSK